MNRLGEKNTFVDEVYNEFLTSDYGVTDTDLNPKRDTTEKMEPAEEVLNKLYGIVESEYKAVSERYNIESIEEIKNDLINTGEIVSVQMTLQEELLETRLGGSLANFGFLIGGADNELPIEKDIKELMLDLLIIEHHFGKSKEEEEKEKDKTKGGAGGGGGSGAGGGGDGSNTGGTGDGDSGGGGGETGNPPGGGDGGGTGPGPGPGPGGGSGGGGSGGGSGGGDSGGIEPGPGPGDTEPPATPDPDAEGDDTPPSEEDKVDDVDPVNDNDNDDANPYKISCFICNDENGEKPTFSAKLTPAEVQRLKEMGIGVERMADDSADDTTDDKTVTDTDNDNNETSFSPKEIADCARYDLQILRIILVVCKIIRALTLILDPIYAITTQIIELAALACGCWSSPANVSEIVQRLIQVVISVATNAASTLIDKLWKMLGLNCLTETSKDLINKIQNALTGLGKISQSVKTTANKFVKTADNIYQDSAQVIEAWNNAKSQFLAKRENDFKSLFNKEAMFGSEGFLQDFKNTLWDNTSTNGWLTGPAASILGNNQVAKDIKAVKKMVESEIEKNKGGKQIKETFGKETQRWGEFSEYFMKNTHFSETTKAWSTEAKKFWDWSRTNEDGTPETPSAGEILLNGFGIDNGSNSSAKTQVNNLTAEQKSNETPAKSVDNVNDPK